MQLLRLLLKTSPIQFSLAALTGLLSGASSAGLIATINLALQNLTQIPGWLPWLFVGLCLLLLVTATASQVLLSALAQTVVYRLLLKLSRRILASPLHHLEQVGTAKLMAVLTEDIEAIAAASATFSALSINLSLLLGCLVYLGWLSVPVLLFVLLFLGLGIVIVQVLLNQGRLALRRARQEQDSLFRHFQAITAGVKELKLHQPRRRAFLKEDLQPTAAAFRQHWVRGMTIFSLAGGLGLVLIFVPLGLLLFVLPQFATLSGALLSSYALTILFLLTPLRAILLSLPQLSQANVSFAKIESLGLSLQAQTTEPLQGQLLGQPPEQPPGQPPKQPRPWQRLTLDHITHTYRTDSDDHPFTLGPIHLTLNAGELVFIVGGNGSGKSTLVKLITGLYAPESGQIVLDEEPIGDRNREAYRQYFSVVFADFFLFERLLGLTTNDSDRQAETYLKLLELERKVEVRDGQLSTLNLSQGQRKRLALLTAYLEDRPIYVFDEWASDQDPVFKAVFYEHLLPALKQRGKTVLVVSHDDRYFAQADRLIKLDYGQVIQDRPVVTPTPSDA